MRNIKEYGKGKYSFSFLRNFDISPKTALAYLKSEFKPTPAMIFGRLVHAVLADEVEKEFMILDESLRPDQSKTMAAKANKEWKEQIVINAESKKLTIVKVSDYEMALKMRKSVMNDKIGGQILNAEGSVEKWFENDVFNGRLDKVIHSKKLIVDYKTVAKINTNWIESDIKKNNLDSQSYIYSKMLNGYDVLLLFIEKSEPFEVLPVMIEADSETMLNGKAKVNIWHNQAIECFETDEWPGMSSNYPDGILYVD